MEPLPCTIRGVQDVVVVFEERMINGEARSWQLLKG